MRPFLLAVLVGPLLAEVSPVITTQLTGLGANSYRETFTTTGFGLGFGEWLEIHYPASLYGSLVSVPQPQSNQGLAYFPLPEPVSTERIYIVQSTANDQPSLVFSVDFRFLGSGRPPGVHPYVVRDFHNVIRSGFTRDSDESSPSVFVPNLRISGNRIDEPESSFGQRVAPLSSESIDINVNISSLVNSDLTTYTGGGNYPQHGGPLMVAGVPFTLATIGRNADTAVVQSSVDANVPQIYSIPVGIFGVTSAFTLINSAGGMCGTTIGELDFVGSSNAFTYPLTEGTNVRDHFNGAFCNNVTTVAGTASFGGGADRLDMQQINLPASFANDTLQRVDFKTFGQGFASGAPFLAAVTILQTVSVPSILLPTNVVVGPGQSAAFPVTLSQPAGPDGVFVTLTSSDQSKVSLGPPDSSSTSFFIPPGATAPNRSLYVYGRTFGIANIMASAPGFSNSSEAVEVAATIKFDPSNVTIFGLARQRWVSLDLSSQAPVNNLTLNLVSDNPAVATVPTSITIPAGLLTVVVALTSVTFGSTTIHANAFPFVSEATAQVSVVPALMFTTTSLPTGKLAAPYAALLSVSGGTPPYTLGLAAGALLPGLSLDKTGQIAGTPTATGTKLPLLFKATDSSSPPQTAEISLTLTIN